MLKNTSGQKIMLFAFNTSTGVPQKSDSANLTFFLSKDFGAVTSLTNSTIAEMDSTNAAGWYVASVSQTETNADTILFSGKSGTASVSVVGQPLYTFPVNFNVTSIDASGRVDIGKILGSAVDTTQTQIGVRVNNFNGNAFDSTAAQVGVRVNNIVANAVDTTSAQLGVRLVNIGAAAVSTTSAQIGVNLINIAGTAVDTTQSQLGVRVNTVTSSAGNTIADSLLDRDMSAGADTGSTTVRTTRQALRFLRNKWSISGTTLTVTKEDDTASSWTATLTTDSTAIPVTAADPAG